MANLGNERWLENGALFMALLGLCSILISCRNTSSITAHSCKPGLTVEAASGRPDRIDLFGNDGQSDSVPFEAMQEPWEMIRTFQVVADQDMEQLLNFKTIEASKRATEVPMSPYRGALVLEDPAGNRPVLVAVKTDNRTIRISNARLSSPGEFVLDAIDFEDLCYITNRPLAEKILDMIGAEPAQIDRDRPKE